MVTKRVINKIISSMKKNISDDIDDEIISYGLEIIITKAVFIAIIIFLGIITKCLPDVIAFIIAFTVIRQYGGGYHADTRIRCFILSVLTLVLDIVMIKLAELGFISMLFLIIITLLSIVYIWIVAPIDTKNKRLDADEIVHYGKRAKVVVIILCLIVCILLFFKINNYARAIMFGIVTEAFLMIAGAVQNYKSGGIYE